MSSEHRRGSADFGRISEYYIRRYSEHRPDVSELRPDAAGIKFLLVNNNNTEPDKMSGPDIKFGTSGVYPDRISGYPNILSACNKYIGM